MSWEANTRGKRYRTITGSEKTGENHFQTSGVITMAAGHGVHDTYTAFLPPLLPTFISHLAISKAQAGLLAVFLQAPSLIQPLIGHLADRYNLRFLVIMAPAVAATMMTLMGCAPGYVLLALLLTVVGLSSAGMHAVGPVMAGRLSGRSLGRGMSLWMVGGELGRTLGPIVVVTAVVHLGLRGLPWLMVAGWAASLVYAIRLRGVSSHHQELEQRLPWWPALRKMRPVLLPLAGIILLRAFIHSSLTIYLPIFLTEEGADLWFAGAALSILQAAGVAGALIGGSVSDRLGRRTVLFISMAAAPAFMFLFLSVHGLGQIIMLVVLGFLVISTTPVMMAMVQESFPQNRALANGAYMSLSFVMRSGAVVLLGILGDHLGLRRAFTSSAVVMLLGLPLLFLLPQSRSKTA
jgi:FSR family fosmidomycin resistance protein-like MFS transporter